MVHAICIRIHGLLTRPRILITPDTKGMSDHLGIPDFQHVKMLSRLNLIIAVPGQGSVGGAATDVQTRKA